MNTEVPDKKNPLKIPIKLNKELCNFQSFKPFGRKSVKHIDFDISKTYLRLNLNNFFNINK